MNNQLIGEKDLKQKLMNLSEEDRFNEINALIDQNFSIGLKLANVVLKNKKHFELLLERGLEQANASDIQVWLKYLIPRLGFRRVIAILSQKLSQNPEQVAQVNKASYWLPKFLPSEQEKSKILLKEFLTQEQQMYKSVTPSGQVYKLILRVKDTGEYAVFGGYELGSKGTRVIVEILNPEDLYPTGGLRQVSPSDLEILDPQPYDV